MFESDFIVVFGKATFERFSRWMYGQTYANPIEHPLTGKGEAFYYSDDIRRFLRNLPVVD